MLVSRKLKRALARWKKQKTRLLVVAGRRKSGKDVLVERVMRSYRGFKHYRLAEAPVLIAKILELPPDRRIQQALFGLNKLLYPVLGELAYKRRVARLLDREKPKYAIVEAIRPKEEYQEFVVKRKGILVGVRADDRIRYERALKDAQRSQEKRDEGKMSFKKFMKRENVEIERDIDWIVRRAHFVLENNYPTRAAFYKEVDGVMSLLGFKKKRRQ